MQAIGATARLSRPSPPKDRGVIVDECPDTQPVPNILMLTTSFPILLNHFNSVNDNAVASSCIDAKSACFMWRLIPIAHIPQLSDAIANFVRYIEASIGGRLFIAVERLSLAPARSLFMPCRLWDKLE
jgi:hypothetical protein